MHHAIPSLPSRVWITLLVAALVCLAWPTHTMAVSPSEISGTWTGTWTSQVYAGYTGSVTVLMQAAPVLGSVPIIGAITMTGPGKDGLTQLPIDEGALLDPYAWYIQALPPGLPYPCFIHLQAQPPYFTATHLAGPFYITAACPQPWVDGGYYELYKVAGLPLDQQAQLDMATRASHDPRFGAAMPESFWVLPDWDPAWELRGENFVFTQGRVVTMYHVTSTVDHAYRYTIFLDPDTGTWADWEQAF